MSPKVFEAFARLIAESMGGRKPRATLEVGAYQWTLLSIPGLREGRRVALNLEFPKSSPELAECEMVVGSANKMEFKDGEFDLVLSSSTLEHDKHFWKSTAEIRRVLSPGGVFIVGVPIYMALPTDVKRTTLTYARHGYEYNADYYRFSEQSVREVLLEDLEVVGSLMVRRYPNPYLLMAGRKK